MTGSFFSVRGACLSHRGKVRSANEDAVFFGGITAGTDGEEPLIQHWSGDRPWLIAVADGMGGNLAGARASREVVEALANTDPITPERIGRRLQELNRQLFDLGQDDPGCRGLGSTVAGLASGPEGVFAFNVGDARVYRMQDRFLAQISHDDSVAEALAASGFLEREGIRPSNLHALTQAVGGKFRFATIEPHLFPVKMNHTARFLICSDGVTDLLSLDEMETVLASSPSNAAAAEALFRAAMDAGGRDNISLIVADVGEALDDSAAD